MPTQNSINTSFPINVASGGTGNTSFTANAIICGGTTTTGALQAVSGVGTTGQALISNGTGALPSWSSSLTAGSYVLISTQNASSSASINFTSGITSTYNNYMVTVSGWNPDSASTLEMQISTNGGSSYLNSGYLGGFVTMNVGANGNTWSTSTAPTPYVHIGTNAAAGVLPYSSSRIMLYNLTGGNAPSFTIHTYENTNGVYVLNMGASSHTSTNINAIQFIQSAGNITAGIFSLYGILA